MASAMELAAGKWKSILLHFGVEGKYLKPKHGPCPWCGGSDRFRFDNKEGSGSFFCSQCGAGGGFNFLMRHKGWDFKTAAKEVERCVGHASADRIPAKMADAARERLLSRLWGEAEVMRRGDIAYEYLAGRSLEPSGRIESLRTHASCPVPHNGGKLPAMLALVQAPDGTPANIHRTFLGPNGKAEIDTVRAMMPGSIPDGSAVRLYRPAKIMGIAEGIETAIAAAKRFQIPVWSAISSAMLMKWVVPDGVDGVVVFGDHDAKYGGQAAAYALAHRIAARSSVSVDVKIPPDVGTDWADLAIEDATHA